MVAYLCLMEHVRTTSLTYTSTQEGGFTVNGRPIGECNQGNVKSLFDQVVARYREELEKLADDPNFKPLFIGIRQAGDEIHAWAVIDGNDCYTRDTLSDLEMDINSDLIPPDMELLMFFDYTQRIPPNGYYRQLYPND
jgi:hypothetical protein